MAGDWGRRRSYELKICAREMIQAALEGVSASAEGSTHNTEQSVPEKRVRTSGEAQTKLLVSDMLNEILH